ncbi:hypothetical protein ACQ4PT_019077 [Festuca glaucescens]
MAPPQPKNRSHVPAKAGQVRPPPGQPGRRMASRDAGERAAFFARREAATVLRRVLRGDASKRSGGSIKSLVFSLPYGTSAPPSPSSARPSSVFQFLRRFLHQLEYYPANGSFVDVETVNGDFLDIDSNDPSYAEVLAILLDPSCSGSGISTERLDHLLPSHSRDDQDDAGSSARIRKLSAFQRKALSHALSFPSVERLVYSTCSIHQAENEDVVNSVLPLATSLGFELATPFPQWRRRGLPVFDGAEHLLRTDPEDDLKGFFIALFVRKAAADDSSVETSKDGALGVKRKRAYTTGNNGLRAFSSLRLSRMDALCSIWRL